MFTPFFLYFFIFCCEKQYKTLSLRNSLAFWKHYKQSKTKWKMLKQKDCETGNQKVLSKSVSCWVPQKVAEGQKELRLRLLWCVSKSVLHTLLSQESPHIDFVVFCILHAPYFWGRKYNPPPYLRKLTIYIYIYYLSMRNIHKPLVSFTIEFTVHQLGGFGARLPGQDEPQCQAQQQRTPKIPISQAPPWRRRRAKLGPWENWEV